MKENTLLKIALICSLLGLFILYFISTVIEIKDYKPNVLSNNVGDEVKLKGAIAKINDRGNAVFIQISQEALVDVVIFSDGNSIKLRNGDTVEIFGKVQSYNGKDEIIAEKIRVIK